VLGVYPQPVLNSIRPDVDVIARIADEARVRAGLEPAGTASAPQGVAQNR
jgi:hypothetical protein